MLLAPRLSHLEEVALSDPIDSSDHDQRGSRVVVSSAPAEEEKEEEEKEEEEELG